MAYIHDLLLSSDVRNLELIVYSVVYTLPGMVSSAERSFPKTEADKIAPIVMVSRTLQTVRHERKSSESSAFSGLTFLRIDETNFM